MYLLVAFGTCTVNTIAKGTELCVAFYINSMQWNLLALIALFRFLFARVGRNGSLSILQEKLLLQVLNYFELNGEQNTNVISFMLFFAYKGEIIMIQATWREKVREP